MQSGPLPWLGRGLLARAADARRGLCGVHRRKGLLTTVADGERRP